MFGRQYKEFMGINGLRFIHPMDLAKVVKLQALLITQPGSSVSAEMRISHKDGRWLWIEAIGTNLLNDKRINAIIVNFHDITDLKEAEERKNMFISMASHELKTPVTSIKALLQLLISHNNYDQRTKNYLERMDFQLNRLVFLINDLLDVSRIQEDKLELKKERFDLRQLAKEIVDDLQRSTTSHKIILNGPKKLDIYADRMRISQVLVNLLTNAIKYSKGGDIFVKIRSSPKRAFVSVKDNGLGINKSDIAKIFNRFYQAKKLVGPNKPGLGLGLYICQTIIRFHGGEISVESKKGKGSTFTFWIPKK